ncbi:unnamed protein product [Phyllotreta striolata]|uniref:isopentenyl-diphosphate Delta-isomerase n=1 Tax=Phyllotreta striolata TaxID=444603 RepID=A0A9N9TQE2_PHYSR|nr:unnamed protein product [Phyllotreta striolata]
MLTVLRSSVMRSMGRSFSSRAASLDNLDAQQQAAMMNENCFLVDETDKIIGKASKKNCHLVNNGELLLHRAFSVFLFNKKGDLLLQKRSPYKITYPNCYTNTCCSHPIAEVAGEENGTEGVKRAAIRRLNYELGIPIESMPLEKFEYITRILYKFSDGTWGEHELDYIFFFKDDVEVDPNPNEIAEVRYIGKNEVDSFVSDIKEPLSPWFRLILKEKLKFWWEHLDNLDAIKDHKNISKF